MTQPRSAPMPAGLRRTTRHPAYDIRCPHCGAAEKARCTTISGRHTKTSPCPARLDAHAIAVAVCTTCQVAPGTPCHNAGRQCPVHDARYTEATGDAA